MNSTHLYPLQLMVQGNIDEPLSLLDIIECLKIAKTITVKANSMVNYDDVDDVLRTFVHSVHSHFDLPTFDSHNPVRNMQLRAIIACVNNMLEMITVDQILISEQSCIFEKTIQDLEHIFCETNDQDLDKVTKQQARMVLAGLCPVYTFSYKQSV